MNINIGEKIAIRRKRFKLNYQNWKAYSDFKALYNSGRVVVGAIDLLISKMGFYHIVFNNRFSIMTTKEVYASIDQKFE